VGKRAFFIKSKTGPWPEQECDKCGLVIADVQDGAVYWNPNKNALHRNICQNCFEVWNHARTERMMLWRKKYAELQAQKQLNEKERDNSNTD
jgi:uncharacterized Fe-S center protein